MAATLAVRLAPTEVDSNVCLKHQLSMSACSSKLPSIIIAQESSHPA